MADYKNKDAQKPLSDWWYGQEYPMRLACRVYNINDKPNEYGRWFGRWVMGDGSVYEDGTPFCTSCGQHQLTVSIEILRKYYYYCPWCGAYMREVKKDG